MIKVGILDDHHIVIHGIQSALINIASIHVIAAEITKEQMEPYLDELDVILLDINLNGVDGIELCKKYKLDFPNLKIICLTSFLQVSFIKAMLRNGADGYLFKNVTTDELIEAIQSVYQGKRYLAKEVNDLLIQDGIESKQKRHFFIPKLTRRETEILELIIDELTNQQIAEKLFISLSTVETHRMNLSAKLGAKNTAGIVRNAIKFGFG